MGVLDNANISNCIVLLTNAASISCCNLFVLGLIAYWPPLATQSTPFPFQLDFFSCCPSCLVLIDFWARKKALSGCASLLLSCSSRQRKLHFTCPLVKHKVDTYLLISLLTRLVAGLWPWKCQSCLKILLMNDEKWFLELCSKTPHFLDTSMLLPSQDMEP